MASLILGIMGKKRSGKDTFAERLVSEHGFTRIAFADSLKAVLKDLDPVVYTHVELDDEHEHLAVEVRLSDVLGPDDDWEIAKELPEVRRLLQILGVAMREHVDPEVWVNAVARKVEQVEGAALVTIPDTRFPNEVDFVRRAGGKTARVTRPDRISTDTHISETAVDGVVPDYLVRNGGTVEDLHRLADSVAHSALAGD